MLPMPDSNKAGQVHEASAWAADVEVCSRVSCRCLTVPDRVAEQHVQYWARGAINVKAWDPDLPSLPSRSMTRVVGLATLLDLASQMPLVV